VRTRKIALSETVRNAIKSGHVPDLRDWRKLPIEKLRTGERVCRFIEDYLCVPEGDLVGKPVELLEFQEVFIQSIFDGPKRARRAFLSVGRKAGKTTVVSCLMLAFMVVKGLMKPNSRVNSAALSREQAALVYNYMSKTINASPKLAGLFRIVPSSKKIISLRTGIEYQALAAESGKAMGLSPAAICGDEWGQIRGPQNDFIDALLTSQGAHSDPIAIVISTQASSDADWLSVQLDDAERSPSVDTVCHLYAADKELEITDPKAWEQACPAIGKFRSIEDVRMQAEQAIRLTSAQAGFENLILNRRISLESLWLAPSVWKSCGGAINEDVFREHSVTIGLDLSMRTDLTAAVMAAQDDDGVVHLKPFVFTPLQGLADRSARDRAPYEQWVRDGFLVAVPGATIDYEWVCEYLKGACDDMGIEISAIEFDRWRIKEMKDAADRVGFASYAEWHEVGQGSKDFSPRIEKFEELMLQGKICHGMHPLLNMAAANAIAVRDPSGNRKLDKSKSTLRIDPLVAAVMGVFAAATADEVGAFIV